MVILANNLVVGLGFVNMERDILNHKDRDYWYIRKVFAAFYKTLAFHCTVQYLSLCLKNLKVTDSSRSDRPEL